MCNFDVILDEFNVAIQTLYVISKFFITSNNNTVANRYLTRQ